MEGDFVVYEGRKVPRAHFRAFVYGTDNKQKLVNSYEEFEAAMATGIWFATKEEANGLLVKFEDKPKKKQSVRAETQDEFLAK